MSPCLILYALLSPAHGSQVVLRHAGDAERIDTPFGEMRRHDARSLCAAKAVYIGVTEDAVPYEATQDQGSGIQTQLSIRVERSLVGQVEAFTSLTAASGELNGRRSWSSLADQGPSTEIGMRHLVASLPLLADAGPALKKGDTVVTLTHRMDPKADLEPEQALTAALDQLCASQALSR